MTALRLVSRMQDIRDPAPELDEGRPYPLQTLEKALGWPPVGRVAMLLALHPNQVRRWRSTGLTAAQADVLAVRCGLHPAEVWRDW